MKKIRNIRILTFVAVSIILLLQGIWTASVYRPVQEQLSEQINEIFIVSVNKDLMNRRNLVVDSTTNEIVGVFENDYEKGKFGGPELVLQEFMIKKNVPLLLYSLDTIFHSEFAKQNLHGTFIINRVNPQTGEILETTDSLKTGKLQRAMASEIIPIRMDGSEGVQVWLVSPYRAVFQKMIVILVLSLLLVLFLGYVLFFLLNSFVKEKQLRQFQTDFSNALIHDMATPLQTIAQVNNLLANEKLYNQPEKRSSYIHIAQQQILNLQALTDRILTLARADRSRLEIRPAEVQLNAVIIKLINKFKVQAKKAVEFTTLFSPSQIRLTADPTLLENAISNLLDNSIKYSGDNVRIDIRCEQKNGAVFIYIKDNGYGVSDKNKRIIFAKFERGEAVTRAEAKGFGLGLAYVKSVMEAHGGTVNLFSERGEGTEFVLYLPSAI